MDSLQGNRNIQNMQKNSSHGPGLPTPCQWHKASIKHEAWSRNIKGIFKGYECFWRTWQQRKGVSTFLFPQVRLLVCTKYYCCELSLQLLIAKHWSSPFSLFWPLDYFSTFILHLAPASFPPHLDLVLSSTRSYQTPCDASSRTPGQAA